MIKQVRSDIAEIEAFIQGEQNRDMEENSKMEVDQDSKSLSSTLKDPQTLFKQCLHAVVAKKWSRLFNVRQDL